MINSDLMEFVDLRLKYKDCSTCKRTLSVNMFSKESGRKWGLRSNCKECARSSKSAWDKAHPESSKRSRSVRMQAAIEYVKAAKKLGCSDCGITYHHSLMDFDHVGEDKWRNVADLVRSGYSTPLIQEEMNKCELVCCVCHRIRTWNRQHPDDPILNGPMI